MAVSRETSAEIRKGLGDIWLVGLGLIPLGLAGTACYMVLVNWVF